MSKKKGKKSQNNEQVEDEFQALRDRLPRVASQQTTSGGITITHTKRTMTLEELDKEIIEDECGMDEDEFYD